MYQQVPETAKFNPFNHRDDTDEESYDQPVSATLPRAILEDDDSSISDYDSMKPVTRHFDPSEKTYKGIPLSEIVKEVISAWRDANVDKFKPAIANRNHMLVQQRGTVLSCFDVLLNKRTEKTLRTAIDMYSTSVAPVHMGSKGDKKKLVQEIEDLEIAKRRLAKEIRESSEPSTEKMLQIQAIAEEINKKKALLGKMCAEKSKDTPEMTHKVAVLKNALRIFSVQSGWNARNNECSKDKMELAQELYDTIEKTVNPTKFAQRKEEERIAKEQVDTFKSEWKHTKSDKKEPFKTPGTNKNVENQIASLNTRERSLLDQTKQMLTEKQPIYDVYKRYKEMAEYELSRSTTIPAKQSAQQPKQQAWKPSNTPLTDADMKTALALKNAGKFVPSHLKSALAQEQPPAKNNKKIECIVPTEKLIGAWKKPISEDTHKLPVPPPPKRTAIATTKKTIPKSSSEEDYNDDSSDTADSSNCQRHTNQEHYNEHNGEYQYHDEEPRAYARLIGYGAHMGWGDPGCLYRDE